MKSRILLITIAFFISGMTWSQVIHVPGDQPTIQAGIDAATDGDTILVAENTYYENIRFMGKAITVGSEYIMDGDSSHIVNTIIDGSQAADPDSAATVMFVNGEDTTSIINGFTITGGSGVFQMTWQVRWGGGIFSWNAGCKIINNIITENHVEDDDKAGGAGIGCGQDPGEFWIVIRNNYVGYNTSLAHGFSAFAGGMSIIPNSIIENNLIEYNTCTNTEGMADGGGIELEALPGGNPIGYIHGNIIRHNILIGNTNSIGAGIVSTTVNVLIEENIISDNLCDAQNNAMGGGVYAYNIADGIDLVDNLIVRNECIGANPRGCGAFISTCGKTMIKNNDINDNISDASNTTAGAGIMVLFAKDTVSIVNNSLINNRAEGPSSGSFGGAICLQSNTFDVVYMEANEIIDNYSDYEGGGVWARDTYRLSIANNLFLRNEANNKGGAIRFYEVESSESIFHPFLSNNDFINNTSSAGGAIYAGYDEEVPIIFNSIFWDNTANTGRDLYNVSDSAMLVYNNDIDVSTIYTPWVGADNILCNPELTSDSLHLDWPSLCVNAGIESLTFEEVTYYCPDQDIDGDARPYESTMPDIGADEAQWLYVGKPDNELKSDIELAVYPNPFNQLATIKIELPDRMNTELFVMDAQGVFIENIASGSLEIGTHQFEWNATTLPGGIYYVVLQSGKERLTLKTIKVK